MAAPRKNSRLNIPGRTCQAKGMMERLFQSRELVHDHIYPLP